MRVCVACVRLRELIVCVCVCVLLLYMVIMCVCVRVCGMCQDQRTDRCAGKKRKRVGHDSPGTKRVSTRDAPPQPRMKDSEASEQDHREAESDFKAEEGLRSKNHRAARDPASRTNTTEDSLFFF